MYRYRRVRPKVSFALATGMVIAIALVMTGILRIDFDLAALDANPQAVAVAIILSLIASLLLYEW